MPQVYHIIDVFAGLVNKDRIKLLAGAYIALAGFVDDDDLIAAEDNPEKTKAIYQKVFEDMETAQEELRRFKLMN